MTGAFGTPGSKFYGGCDEWPVGGSSSNPGRFELTTETDSGGSSLLKFENPYYDVGGLTYEGPTTTGIPGNFTGVVALRVDMTGESPSADVVPYLSIPSMRAAQANRSYYILPLYQLDGGSVKCDFRVGPPAVAGEFAI